MGHLARAARRWAPLLLLALVASACSAFADDEADAGSSPESSLPAAATLLRVASTDWPACLNPLTCADGAARTPTADPGRRHPAGVPVYRRATAAGATITRELAGTDYGSRDFIAEDPEGNRWSFGTYSGAQ